MLTPLIAIGHSPVAPLGPEFGPEISPLNFKGVDLDQATCHGLVNLLLANQANCIQARIYSHPRDRGYSPPQSTRCQMQLSTSDQLGWTTIHSGHGLMNLCLTKQVNALLGHKKHNSLLSPKSQLQCSDHSPLLQED